MRYDRKEKLQVLVFGLVAVTCLVLSLWHAKQVLSV